MSTLTKICVVLLVVLVLFASVVFIHKAVADKNWKELALQQNRRATIAEAEARSQQLAAGMWANYFRAERTRADGLAQTMAQRIETKDAEIERITGDRVAIVAIQNDLTAQLTVAQNTINSQAEQVKILDKNLQAQRLDNIKQADQVRRQEEALKDFTAKLEIAERSARELSQQLAVKDAELKDNTAKMEQLENELRRLKALLPKGTAGTGEPRPVSAAGQPKLEGSVTAVQGDLASLNIGAASGVTRDMIFIVYRGADFVAHLRIAEVFASSSAGVIYDVQRDVKQGDKASTNLGAE